MGVVLGIDRIVVVVLLGMVVVVGMVVAKQRKIMMVVVLGMVVVVLGIVVVVGMVVTKQREVCLAIFFFSKMTSNPRLRKLGEIEGTDGLVALFGDRERTEGSVGVGRGLMAVWG